MEGDTGTPKMSERDNAIFRAVWIHTDEKTTEGPIEPILKAIRASGFDATDDEVELTRSLLKKVRAAEAQENAAKRDAWARMVLGEDKYNDIKEWK